jgi:hypothetical protein
MKIFLIEVKNVKVNSIIISMLPGHSWDKIPYQLKSVILPNVKILRLVNKQTFSQSIPDWIEYFTCYYNITEQDICEYLKYSPSIRIMYDIRLFKVKTFKSTPYGTFYQGTIELSMKENKLKVTFEHHEGYAMEYNPYDRDEFEWTTLNYKFGGYFGDTSIKSIINNINYQGKLSG